jgi:hypothetical protein
VLAATPALPVMLAVVLAGNLALGGVFAVALPVLVHQRFGTSGYGLVLAALAAGAVAVTTLGAWIRSRRPAVTARRLFLAQTAALVLFPSPLSSSTTTCRRRSTRVWSCGRERRLRR